MPEKLTLKIGGVPEHFNLPWHNAIEKKMFAKEGIAVNWTDYPGGTGAMANDLSKGKLDLAVLLTEGIITDIAKGNPSKIISLYVSSPLIWGIYVPAHSDILSIEGIKGKKYAISRNGSGSHLMAYVDAKFRGWQIKEDQLKVVGNLEGARNAFKNREAEVFMWEKFMTKPLVDNGEFRQVGECPTPWPCFVVAARNEIIENHSPLLKKLLAITKTSSIQFKKEQKAAKLISERYGIKEEDAAEWLGYTQWDCGAPLTKEICQQIIDTLNNLRLIEKPVSPEFVSHDLM